jgi:hypothetical protein
MGLTRGIKNFRDSRLFKVCSPLQLFVYIDRKKARNPLLAYCQTLAEMAMTTVQYRNFLGYN